MKTQDQSKFAQMAGESATALALWNNIGSWVKISNIPKEQRVCLLCGAPATQAEHLINKAHGGNHTPDNVIPVCNSHKKKAGNAHWTESYTIEQQRIIRDHINEDNMLNPYHEENQLLVEDLRAHMKAAVLSWRTEKGMI